MKPGTIKIVAETVNPKNTNYRKTHLDGLNSRKVVEKYVKDLCDARNNQTITANEFRNGLYQISPFEYSPEIIIDIIYNVTIGNIYNPILHSEEYV